MGSVDTGEQGPDTIGSFGPEEDSSCYLNFKQLSELGPPGRKIRRG